MTSAALKDTSDLEARPACLVDAGRVRFRRLRQDQEAFAVARAVSRSRHVTMRALLGRGRGDAATAATRQLAMYLVHVLLGRPQDIVGQLFGRDASTVSHACRVIEDLRDNPPLEVEIEAIEHSLVSVREDVDAA